MYTSVVTGICLFVFVCMCVSMDGFRVVKLEDVLPHLDLLVTATGKVLWFTLSQYHANNYM